MTMADIVARMERSEIRGRRRVIPGLRCAPSGLRSLRVRPNLLKRINKRTRGCGCDGHPAFPTPSLGGRSINASGALRREGVNVCLDVIASGEIAVGTLISERPPHRSVRAAFPHTAPTSGE